MTKYFQIAQLIKIIAGNAERSKLMPATVLSVDKIANTVNAKLLANNFIITAHLQSKIKTKNGFHIYPAVNSSVMVLSNAIVPQYNIVATEEIESIVLRIDNKEVINVHHNGDIIINGNITFNGGDNNGMVLINKLVEKLNNIENQFNTLVNDFNKHSHLVGAVPSQATIPTIPPTVSSLANLNKTNRSQIENKKILQ